MKITRLLLSLTISMTSYALMGQNSVGIGTETPNPNAVLQLISPTNNQGFLIPTMTTAQRMDAGFTSGLTDSDEGLMVYDADDNSFYYWVNGAWDPISAQTLTAGTGLQIFGNVISNAGDLDSTNEIQDLALVGDTLTITNSGNATIIDLGAYRDNTDSQTMTFDGLTNSLSISGGNAVDLSALAADSVDDADADPTNEIQDLNLTGNILTITGHASPTEINLASYTGTNTDEQTLSLSGSLLSITGGNEIDISAVDTDAQNLAFADGIISLTGDPDSTNIDLSPYLDNTDAQDLSLTGNTLSLSGDGTTVDLSGYLDDTDNQVASEVPVTAGSGITSTNVQNALVELQGEITSNAGQISVLRSGVKQILGSDFSFYNANTSLSVVYLNSGTKAMVRSADTPPQGLVTGMSAPVQLPHGATINSITMYVSVDEAANLPIIRYYRWDVRTPGVYEELGFIEVPQTGLNELVLEVGDPTIDYQNYVYTLEFETEATSSGAVVEGTTAGAIHYAVIDYSY